MRIKEIINESIDQPYEWHWFKDRSRFKILVDLIFGDAENPKPTSKLATRLGADISAAFDVDDDIIVVLFRNKGSGFWDLTFDSKSNLTAKKPIYSNTGAGHASRIMATIVEIFNEFVERYEPNGISFTAHDKKRARLYKRMIQKFDLGKYASHDYYDDEIGAHGFDLTRTNQ